MAICNKLKIVEKLRKSTDSVFLKLPLPKINPNMVSGISILTSLIFILTLSYSIISLVFLIITILLDWFDGLIAKKHNLVSEQGYITDITVDRVSETLILIPFFIPWFFLFALNNVLTLVCFVRKKHIILPLRHLFLIYFTLIIFGFL